MTTAMTTAKNASKPPVRKAPTDRQPSKADQLAAREAERPEGWELLKPVTDLRSGDVALAQASLMELFEEMGLDLTEQAKQAKAAKDAGEEIPDVELEVNAKSIRAMASLGQLLEEYSIDAEAFAEFDTGEGALSRVISLAMYYVNALGE